MTTVQEILTPATVVVGAAAADCAAAIAMVGRLLVATGSIEPAYVDSMLEREQIVSTYLGNGVALPHGTDESKASVNRTGIAVVQFPAGVDWGDEAAHLVVGLAARSNDHVPILAQLAAVLEDPILCERLGTSATRDEIYAALAAAPAEDEP
jgi:mannitol/fructose-specific phosphotransferase system IIA component